MPYAKNLTKAKFGIEKKRPAAILPQTAQATLFNVVGGRIIVTGLVGEVTTVMTATAANISIVSNPTVGADLAISGVVAIESSAVGVQVGLNGVLATALAKGLAVPMAAGNGIVCSVGTIDVLTSGSNATGQMKWTLYYMPLDDGSYVTVA